MPARQLRVVADSEVSISDERLDAVDKALDALHRQTPLIDFLFRKDPDSDSYLYRFRVVDGRVWSQTIVFDATPTNPLMTFGGVTGQWRLTEFVLHRAVRDSVIALRNSGMVTLIEKKWT